MQENFRVSQIPGNSKRRWFSSNDFDLIVWLSDDQDFIGFELCYDKFRNERSIRWWKSGGYSHMAIDDGEQQPGKFKETLILVADGFFDANRVYSSFHRASPSLPKDVVNFVLQALEQHPNFSLRGPLETVNKQV